MISDILLGAAGGSTLGVALLGLSFPIRPYAAVIAGLIWSGLILTWIGY